MTLSLTSPTFPATSNADAATYLDGGTALTNEDPLDFDVPDTSAVSPTDGPIIADATSFADMTPDALMAYCQARFSQIDGQADGILAQQQLSNSESSALQTVLQGFQQYTSGVTNDPGTCTKLETSLYNLIEQMKSKDPGSAELGKLEQTYNNLLYSGTGPVPGLQYADPSLYPPDMSTPPADSNLGTTEMQTYVSDLQGCASDMSSGSEIQMIQLQSLMSQRQTAVELTTNLVQSLGDQSEKIAENVGH